MITVRTWHEDGGCWLVIRGHAEATMPDLEEDPLEGVRVCASVSALSFTLYDALGGEEDPRNEWDGDHNGYIKIFVPDEHHSMFDFVMHGIALLVTNYSDKVQHFWEP